MSEKTQPVTNGDATEESVSVLRRRWRKFRTLKRGWWSFCALFGLYFLSFANPLLINNRALVIHYQGSYHFPVFENHHEAKEFGQRRIGEVHYRLLKKQFREQNEGNWVIMPPYPYHPNESLLTDPDLPGNPPHSPSLQHLAGTDDRGRDVFARLAYGFRISITFGLAVIGVAYFMGVRVETGLLGVLGILGFGALVAFGVTCLSLSLALKLKGHASYFIITGVVTLLGLLWAVFIIFMAGAIGALGAAGGF